jgi:hypothetical protein
MHVARDAFAGEEAPLEMPNGAVLSWITGTGLGVGGWLSSSGLVTEESLSLQSSKAFFSGSTVYLIDCLGVQVPFRHRWSNAFVVSISFVLIFQKSDYHPGKGVRSPLLFPADRQFVFVFANILARPCFTYCLSFVTILSLVVVVKWGGVIIPVR